MGRLKEVLASHLIDLPSDSIEFRSLAAEGMRSAIAAMSLAEQMLDNRLLKKSMSGDGGDGA